MPILNSVSIQHDTLSIELAPKYVIQISLPRASILKSSGTVVSSVERNSFAGSHSIREFQLTGQAILSSKTCSLNTKPQIESIVVKR